MQGSGHSQDVKEASDEEVNDDKRGGSEKKRKEVRALFSVRSLVPQACFSGEGPAKLCCKLSASSSCASASLARHQTESCKQQMELC